MTGILRAGQTVCTGSSTSRCEVVKLLGGGGQGEVYEARIDGRPVALKWYFRHMATSQQRKALDHLVKKGAPTEQFLWPMCIAEEHGLDGFGYVMPLREPRFKSIVDLMKRRVEPSFRCVATACFGLASGFLELHTKGLCYRDISFGNVFLDPRSGEVRICDNDNVAVDREAHAGVLGTPRFMAPEVVRGEKKPSRETDQFSLAVLLFYMLVMHHPLEGQREASIRCMDLPAMNMLYGKEPVFIFDPKDRSNEPVQGFHDNAIVYWPIYPSFLRELFVTSFTEGLKETDRRITDSQWRKALVRLRDAIMFCAGCGAEVFYESDEAASASRRCWSCGVPIRNPLRISLPGQTVVLNPDTRLYPYHVAPVPNYDFTTPVAEVARHPSDPKIWGLKNTSSSSWGATTAAGESHDVQPGRSITLALGTRISFGGVEGVVEA